MSRVERQSRITIPGAAFLRDFHDFPDRRSAATAFDPASQTAVDLMGAARQLIRAVHDRADVMVSQYIAGANDHGVQIQTSADGLVTTGVTRCLIYSAASTRTRLGSLSSIPNTFRTPGEQGI